jgi:hypothetical protein
LNTPRPDPLTVATICVMTFDDVVHRPSRPRDKPLIARHPRFEGSVYAR